MTSSDHSVPALNPASDRARTERERGRQHRCRATKSRDGLYLTARSPATAALEFALASPLLLVILCGAADFGLAQYYRTSLANAVSAGAQYAYLTGTGVTTTNIRSVVQDAMNLPAGASANLSVSFTDNSLGASNPGWYCITGSGPSVAVSSQGSNCSDGSAAGYYLSFGASYTNTGLLSGILTGVNRTMSESVTLRLQ
jgi:Flp pilus assembly protein TadG